MTFRSPMTTNERAQLMFDYVEEHLASQEGDLTNAVIIVNDQPAIGIQRHLSAVAQLDGFLFPGTRHQRAVAQQVDGAGERGANGRHAGESAGRRLLGGSASGVTPGSGRAGRVPGRLPLCCQASVASSKAAACRGSFAIQRLTVSSSSASRSGPCNSITHQAACLRMRRTVSLFRDAMRRFHWPPCRRAP